jgi:hypothetical protein
LLRGLESCPGDQLYAFVLRLNGYAVETQQLQQKKQS